MFSRDMLRRLALLGALISLLTVLAPASAVEGKRFAADGFNWWPSRKWVDHFEVGDLDRDLWNRDGHGSMRQQNGMLTVDSKRYGSMFAVRTGGPAKRYGRWEVRVRAQAYETGHQPYAVGVELIPKRRGAYHCGAQNVAVGRWVPTHHAAHFYTRSRHAHEFRAVKAGMNFENGYWHTFAVEVRPKRIAWFVDGTPMAVEKRDAALSHRAMVVRVGLQGMPKTRMNRSRVQVDTIRYFTLDTPNSQHVSAPRADRGHYDDAC
jgi:hypothetical protein